MARVLVGVAAGCCLALAACGSPAERDLPSPTPTVPHVALPKPKLPWNEDFAAHIELERVNVGGESLLLPKGIRLPEDATVAAATEATVVLAEPDPAAVVRAVESSARRSGYVEYAAYDDVTVWLGHGMVVRLEARRGAQVLAWAPESMKDAFADSH